MKSLCLCVTFLLITITCAVAQTPAPKPDLHALFGTIAQADAGIFSAFNAHDAARVMSFFTKDVEFYHDKDGLSHYDETAESFRKLFANVPDIHRELVNGTLEVYPLKDDGAIEVGQHRFTHKENGKEETGLFKFVHIWQKAGDHWKISRVVSYGH
jgi:ketosteroid isomerase-like protein